MPTTSSNARPDPPAVPATDASFSGTRRTTRTRRLLALAVGLPTVAVAALLIWGIVQSGGRPGGVIVNNTFGEISITRRPAPEFSIETFDGQTLDLQGLRGRVVMVDFWASWCPPCRREAPELAATYELYRGLPVEFIGIDVWDSESAALAYIKRYGITYPNGPDPGGRVTIDYGVRGIPEKFFIDQEGNLVRKFIGPMDRDALANILDEMLLGDDS